MEKFGNENNDRLIKGRQSTIPIAQWDLEYIPLACRYWLIVSWRKKADGEV